MRPVGERGFRFYLTLAGDRNGRKILVRRRRHSKAWSLSRTQATQFKHRCFYTLFKASNGILKCLTRDGNEEDELASLPFAYQL